MRDRWVFFALGAALLALAGCRGATGTDGGCVGTTCDAGNPGTDATAPGTDGGTGTDAAEPTDAGCIAAAGACEEESWVVTGGWLEANLGKVRVVDLRSQSSYDAGHIPAATRLSVSDLMTTVAMVPSEVVPAATLESVLSAAGIAAGDLVVAYDSMDGMDADRFAWTLRYYDHADVRVLDGGWPGWSNDGRPISTAPDGPPPSTYVAGAPRAELNADADWVFARLDDPTVFIVDARTASEYAAGHIPGAINVNWSENLSGGLLRPRDELLALYAALPPGAQIVTYCTTGMRGAVDWFVLRWLGYPDVRVYDGSWIDWSNRPGFPIEN